MKNRGLLIVLGILFGVAVIAGAYVFLAEEEKVGGLPSATLTPSPTPIPASSLEPESEVLEIEVSGGEYKFDPASLAINEGERVKLTFKNEGKFPHNLTIDELNVATRTIAGGQGDTVEFTAKKSGTFAVYCSVGTHRQQGMEGEVTVN